MSDANVNSPLFTDAPKASDRGWPWRKIFFLTLFAVAAHFALIYFLGTKQKMIRRAVTHVPQLRLANTDDELIALANPTLFALPNWRDFSSALWTKIPTVPAPEFNWTEPPQWLVLDSKNLGAAFRQFTQANRLAEIQVGLKPQAELASPEIPDESTLPQNSRLKFIGELAQRSLMKPIYLPAQFINDVIPPSKVQVLVSAAGDVVSAVLLPSNNSIEAAERNGKADQKALEIARQLRFTTATHLTLGEMIFNWHTLPDVSTIPAPTQ